jgi:hypothetical protein
MLVTGGQSVMTGLVSDFTGESPGRAMHEPVILVGNDRTGVWTEADGLASPEALIKVIDRVAQAPSP